MQRCRLGSTSSGHDSMSRFCKRSNGSSDPTEGENVSTTCSASALPRKRPTTQLLTTAWSFRLEAWNCEGGYPACSIHVRCKGSWVLTLGGSVSAVKREDEKSFLPLLFNEAAVQQPRIFSAQQLRQVTYFPRTSNTAAVANATHSLRICLAGRRTSLSEQHLLCPAFEPTVFRIQIQANCDTVLNFT
jgi:hypothetical protein